jgi:hypothetical protein
MDEPERWGFRANQWAAILSLWEVIDYLRQDVTISRLKLDRPLWECMAALVDANNGLSPSLFTPAAKAKPGKSMARNNIESISCLAMQELLEASFKRDEAARRVAEVLAKKQPSIKPRHNATLKSTVAGWRERAMQVRGGKEFEEKLAYWRHYHSKISSGTSTARQRADDLLSILKRPSTLTF